MDHEDYQRAAEHWQVKDRNNVNMPEDALHRSIETYILQNNTCALATGTGDFIRCTPIEYTYHEGAFWMFSEGGEKFIGLEKNKHVCLAIYDKYDGFGSLKGMQVMGTAEMIEPFSKEYEEAAEFKNIPLTALKQLPEPMNLIKVVPAEIDFLNSDFKKDGYASRQKMVF
jgi:nitroimidazol reductase NimA-like FMN-containing flavoprotein (pyridoxamine 5'-phosphate oxidase superfamily)